MFDLENLDAPLAAHELAHVIGFAFTSENDFAQIRAHEDYFFDVIAFPQPTSKDTGLQIDYGHRVDTTIGGLIFHILHLTKDSPTPSEFAMLQNGWLVCTSVNKSIEVANEDVKVIADLEIPVMILNQWTRYFTLLHHWISNSPEWDELLVSEPRVIDLRMVRATLAPASQPIAVLASPHAANPQALFDAVASLDPPVGISNWCVSTKYQHSLPESLDRHAIPVQSGKNGILLGEYRLK